jgi:hypothetical protein
VILFELANAAVALLARHGKAADFLRLLRHRLGHRITGRDFRRGHRVELPVQAERHHPVFLFDRPLHLEPLARLQHQRRRQQENERIHAN